MLERVRGREKIWDIVIIGGGATGVGCAVDAALRGFDVLLLEQSDFGKGTSSRSTKLIHGGVRYLAQGNFSLVREALEEREILRRNAAHLVTAQPFVVPCYSFWQKYFYGAGLKFYDFLSGECGFGKSKIISKTATVEKLPNVKRQKLRGAVVYFDGQFDDTRLLINLAMTAVENGATILNYAKVFGLTKTLQNQVEGVKFQDLETGANFETRTKVVVNATGAFCDAVRKLSDENAEKIIAPSQGVHLVFDKKFLPSENALMIPKTSDGRVLFAIPWHGKTLIGTTDTPIERIDLEARAFDEEIEFILENAGKYLVKSPKRADIQSVFAGIRPLVNSAAGKTTARLARDHTIKIDKSNLLTITGGKWTTYRRMAEDTIDQAIKIGSLGAAECRTKNLKIHGCCQNAEKFGDLAIYGADAEKIQKLIEENTNLAGKLHADLPYRAAEIVWATRFEMARTVEDALARRTRALFLDARAAIAIAPQVARIMARESGKNEAWIDQQIQAFTETARNYQLIRQ